MARDQISAREASRLFGVSTRTIYNMLRSGDLPGTQWRGRWVISRAALIEKLRGSDWR